MTKDNNDEPVWGFRDFNERSREISGTLRTWLVAYGVGAPILFFSEPSIMQAMKYSGMLRKIVFLFLSGVAIQVLIAFMNKWLTWFRSEVIFNPEKNEVFLYKLASDFHKAVWPDIIADIYALFAFGYATYLTVLVFT